MRQSSSKGHMIYKYMQNSSVNLLYYSDKRGHKQPCQLSH